ncbi:uncharacterized protein LOC134276185 [Saccostrea cucullata]|uniref:uncharacterized protein LOC134276185 n=1 Tax=Saccostrea cuccullata TaxID=36930 RepID=UPI002ED5B41B
MLERMNLGFERALKYWREQGLIDAKINRELRHQHGKGPCNIFILDTPSSLGEEGFNEMKDTFRTIITGYENQPEEDENVAVIICGKNTRFQRYFSNQYSAVSKCLDDVEYGGLSPLMAAFILCLESTHNGASHTSRMQEFQIRPRVILMSDGRPTPFQIISEADDSDLQETEDAKNNLQLFARQVGRRHPIFCIPLGKNPDMLLLEFMCAESRGGKIVFPYEALQFSRYSKNVRTAALLSSLSQYHVTDRDALSSIISMTIPGNNFTEMDKDDIFELWTKKSLYTSEPSEEDEDSDGREGGDLEKRDPCMPDLGVRVKRGPDWQWKNQDSHGPGTVIGYSREGWLRVEWDVGGKNVYRYGPRHDMKNVYDVIPCNIPRVLEENEPIGTGCLVKRGPDWEWDNQDGGEGNIGSVIRVRSNATVNVKWSNGSVSNYRFGYKEKFDLQICDPFSQETEKYLQEESKSSQPKTQKEKIYNFKDSSSYEGSKSTSFECSQSDRNHLSSLSSNSLKYPKGKYFKNDSVEDECSTDLESDGPIALSQWMWKDKTEKWNPYPKKINDKIWKSWKRNPNSTVVVEMDDSVYRVVLGKNIQINLTTGETMDIQVFENS